MIKFPKELGLFDLSGFSFIDGKSFNKQNEEYLMVNKRFNTSTKTYMVKFDLVATDLYLFFDFWTEIYKGSESFNVFVLKTNVVEINCKILGGYNLTYSGERAYLSFNIIENFEII